MDTAEVLRTARENLPGHWYQGMYSDGHGNRCAVGHIMHASGIDIDASSRGEWGGPIFDNTVSAALGFLGSVIKEQYPETIFEGVPDWNDTDERTEDEVITIFEKAIAKAEEL